MTQGSHANKTGSVLEEIVKATLLKHGFTLIPYREHINAPELHGNELLLTNVPYTTIYGARGYTEFLLKSEKYNLETRIECKWQQSAGSVDEKLPYTYLSCAEAVPEDDVIILIDGEGFRDGAKHWLRDAALRRKYVPDDRPNKFIRIMSATEFMTWANIAFSS